MVVVDVQEDRRLGRQVEQRAVALVGLGHEPGPAAPHRARCRARRRSSRPRRPTRRRARRAASRWSSTCRGPRRRPGRGGRPSARPAAAERCSTGRPRRRASTSSGLSAAIAVETTRADGAGRERVGAVAGPRRRCPPARSASSMGDSSRSVPRHRVARRPGEQGEPAHAGAPDPHQVDGRGARPSPGRSPAPGPQEPGHDADGAAGGGPAAAASTSSATRSAASGRPTARGRLGHRLEAAAVGQQRPDQPAQALAAAVGVGQHHRGPGLGEPARVLGLVVGRSRAGRARGSTGGRSRPARTPNPPEREITRSAAAIASGRLSSQPTQPVARPGRVRLEQRAGPRRPASGPATWITSTGGSSPNASIAARLSVRAPWLPPTTRMTVAPGSMPERPPAGGAGGLGDGAAHRAAGDHVAAARSGRRAGRRG